MWLYNYLFRNKITISSTTSATTEVKILLDSTNFDFSKTDGSDIEFATKSGVILPHFTYKFDTVAQEAEIYVKTGVPDEIYMYYGLPKTTTNDLSIFVAYDDFDPDRLTWTVYSGTWSDTTGYEGYCKDGVNDGSVAKCAISAGSVAEADFVLNAKMLISGTNSIGDIVIRADDPSAPTNALRLRLDGRAVDTTNHYGGFHLIEYTSSGANFVANYDVAITLDQWYDVQLFISGANAVGYLNGTQVWTTSSITVLTAGYLSLNVEAASGNEAKFDKLILRDYINAEPSAIVGSLETFNENLGVNV